MKVLLFSSLHSLLYHTTLPSPHHTATDTYSSLSLTHSLLSQMWSLMKVICFEDNARGELLSHLGFDSTVIAAAAEEYVRSKTGQLNLYS